MAYMKPNNETENKIKAWKDAHMRLQRVEQEQSAAKTALMNATNELSK